jgi:hypothetical protein
MWLGEARGCSGEVLGGGEEVDGGANEGSSVQLFWPERDDVARGSSRMRWLDRRGSEGCRR